MLGISSLACSSAKEVIIDQQQEETAVDGKISGVIRISNNGCSPIIEATENGELVKMYPVNLDESYKSDGLKIRFTYIPSRAMQPDACTFQLKVISIENVEPYK